MIDKPFECTILTPMFLAGADIKRPELRAPGIKGAMMYWWRAVQRYSNIDDLKKEEAKIFGNSDSCVGRAKFRLLIKNRELTNGSSPLLPRKNKPLGNCLKAGGTFNLELSGRNVSIMEKAQKVFKLSAILGGLGRRSRRGSGSYFIKDDNDIDLDQKILSLLNSLLNSDENNSYVIKDVPIDKHLISNVIVGPDTLIDLQRNQGISEPMIKNYPQIKYVITKKIQKMIPGLVLKKIGEASHTFSGNDCGSIKPTRLASPVYCSLYKDNTDTFLVITLLSSKMDQKYQEQFINEVISNVK